MKKIRNILSLALVFIMLIGLMPMNVFAADPQPGTETFKVTFNVGEHGTAPAEQNVAKDAKVIKPEDPKADGFKFEGWFADKELKTAYKFETPVTQAITLYAKWKEETPATETFKVTFNVGEHGTAPAEQNVAKDAKVIKPEDPKADGFKFEGWFADKELKTAYKFETPVTQAITLYAKWIKVTPQPKPETKEYTISKAYTNHGSFTVDKKTAKKDETITVNATPNYGYAVKSVYYIENNIKHIIKNYAYNDYYYYRYNDRYYNDYNYYYSDYRNNYYYDYADYEDYLKDRHPSFWKNGYRYWDEYDYRFYDRYDNYYYKYLDDYNRYYSDRYATYEDYLKVYHYPHYRDYYDYRYDYRYHNYRYGYNTSDTFDMPASDVTVYVEFTDWTYYGYYYDDYYYYRSRRDKEAEEAKAKKEQAKKEEEEAKAKAEAAKQPQIYENKAVIAIGSNVLDKVSKNVHTVHEMDTPAYVKDGRVMLPLRYVAEALGLQVSWVPETKTVIIWDLTQRVEIPVKSNRIIVNGITYTSDVKPEIKNERTMLPIANIARALGLIDGSDIVWDQYNKQVTLTRKVLSK